MYKLNYFIFLFAFLIAACSPIYRSDFQYEPPADATGKMCITQCMQNKGSCQQMCQMKRESCRSRSRENAYFQYQAYKAEQERHGEPIKRSIRDFDNGYFECHQPCHCNQGFNSCYSACGGQVIEKKVCVAFCDKDKSSRTLIKHE